MSAEVEMVEILRKVDQYTSVTVRVPKEQAEQEQAAQTDTKEPPQAEQAVRRARKP